MSNKNTPINNLSNVDLNQIFYEKTGCDGFGKFLVINFEGFAFRFTGHTNTKNNQQSIFMIPVIDADDIKPRIILRDDKKDILDQCFELLKSYSSTEQFKKFKTIISNNSPPSKH